MINEEKTKNIVHKNNFIFQTTVTLAIGKIYSKLGENAIFARIEYKTWKMRKENFKDLADFYSI